MSRNREVTSGAGRQSAWTIAREWFGVLAGPVAWSLHLVVSYALLSLVCATGLVILLHLATLVTLGMTVLGGIVSYRLWKESGVERELGAAPPSGMRGFMGASGLLLNIFFFGVILLEGVPNFVLDPCAT